MGIMEWRLLPRGEIEDLSLTKLLMTHIFVMEVATLRGGTLAGIVRF